MTGISRQMKALEVLRAEARGGAHHGARRGGGKGHGAEGRGVGLRERYAKSGSASRREWTSRRESPTPCNPARQSASACCLASRPHE